MKFPTLLISAIILSPALLCAPAHAQCQFTRAGCSQSVGDVLERWRQDQRDEDIRRAEREKQRILIENYQRNQDRKVPPPLVVTAPKHGPGQTPEEAARQQGR